MRYRRRVSLVRKFFPYSLCRGLRDSASEIHAGVGPPRPISSKLIKRACAASLSPRSAGRALAVLTELSAGTGGTLRTMQMTAAILLALAACMVPLYSHHDRGRYALRCYPPRGNPQRLSVAVGNRTFFEIPAAARRKQS